MEKTFLGALTILIGVVSYFLYCRGIFKKKIRPDAFSWLTWGVLAAVTFCAQFASGAGPGMWVTGFTALMCLIIAALSIKVARSRLKTIDAVSLLGAALGLGLWGYTNNPLLAVLCVIFVGAIGFVPTFYKSYKKPQEEGMPTFALNALKFGIAFFALDVFAPVNYLYPLAMVFLNTSLALLLFVRRRRG